MKKGCYVFFIILVLGLSNFNVVNGMVDYNGNEIDTTKPITITVSNSANLPINFWSIPNSSFPSPSWYSLYPYSFTTINNYLFIIPHETYYDPSSAQLYNYSLNVVFRYDLKTGINQTIYAPNNLFISNNSANNVKVEWFPHILSNGTVIFVTELGGYKNNTLEMNIRGEDGSFIKHIEFPIKFISGLSLNSKYYDNSDFYFYPISYWGNHFYQYSNLEYYYTTSSNKELVNATFNYFDYNTLSFKNVYSPVQSN